MSIPSLKKQYFGDLNQQLNQIRARMNNEIKDKFLEILSKKQGDKEGSNI